MKRVKGERRLYSKVTYLHFLIDLRGPVIFEQQLIPLLIDLQAEPSMAMTRVRHFPRPVEEDVTASRRRQREALGDGHARVAGIVVPQHAAC